MFLLIVSLVVVLPLIELYFIVQVGQELGLIPTVALLIVISAIGSALVKREGLKAFRRFVAAAQTGEELTKEIANGVCILAAGVFLLAPGFISDILGIALLLSQVRLVIVGLVGRRIHGKTTVIRGTHSGPRVDYRGYLSESNDVIDVEPHEGDDER
jgi:UPF0716 protein FxsA